MRYAGEICPHIKIVHWGVCFHVISALYPFNEGHFPGIDTCNQLSLSVIDLQQVVIVAGGQCVHYRVSVCKQLHREHTHESLIQVHLNRLLLFCYTFCCNMYTSLQLYSKT